MARYTCSGLLTFWLLSLNGYAQERTLAFAGAEGLDDLQKVAEADA